MIRCRRERRRALALLAVFSAAVAGAGPAPQLSAAPRPNLLLVVVDDLGFSDLGVTGGEIPTPTIDRLARQGVLLTQFNTMPTCSPTRAALLTGRHPHRVGLGTMKELTASTQQGRPGYAGHLRPEVPTIAERLRSLGYATYMAGKWHLGDAAGQLPVDRGFDRSLAMLHGGASHMDLRGYTPEHVRAAWVEDSRPARLEPPFHSSDVLAERLLSYIRSGPDPKRPFFAYLSYTAPHAPLQAPDFLLAAEARRYERGWDEVRRTRFARLQQLGLVSRDARLAPRWTTVPAWESLTDSRRAFEAARMAAYAAMVRGIDLSLARLLEGLSQDGLLEDTVLIFMSDNGAEASDFSTAPGLAQWFSANWDNTTTNIGRASSYVFPGPGWAQVSGTPNRLFKGLPTSGGTRVAAFVHATGRYAAGRRVATFTSVLDVAPTLWELAGGQPVEWDGRSLEPVLAGRSTPVRAPAEGLGVELLGNAAYVQDEFKIVRLRTPWGTGEWELYDLQRDPEETRDLAPLWPQRVERMARAYADHARSLGIVDVPPQFQPYPLVPRIVADSLGAMDR